MSTSRFCRACKNFHDLDEPWPEACYGHFANRGAASIQIIADIQPYQAIAADVATGKPPPRIGSRREHREFLKRNKYVEVGNEWNKPRERPTVQIDSPREDIRRAVREVLGRRQ
jgi:hypothetical protein